MPEVDVRGRFIGLSERALSDSSAKQATRLELFKAAPWMPPAQ
jgi:hypothetical protein